MDAGGTGRGSLPELLKILPTRLRYSRRLTRLFRWGPAWEKACAQRLLLERPAWPGVTGNEQVVYLICLIGRDRAKDWRWVGALLRQTLEALLAQADPRWQAIICGQDWPEGMPENRRSQFLPFTAAPEDTPPHDKNDKYDRLTDWVPQSGIETGYAFLLDGDDVPHPDLTGYILSDNNGTGYLLDQGYMLAVGTRRGRVLGHRSLRDGRLENNTFFRNCGSCVAAYFDNRRGGWGTALLEGVVKVPHGRLPELTRLMGVRLGWVPFPAMCYLILHGENDYVGRQVPPKLSEARVREISRAFPGLYFPEASEG